MTARLTFHCHFEFKDNICKYHLNHHSKYHMNTNEGGKDINLFASPLPFSMLWRDWRSCARMLCAPVCLWKTLLRSSSWPTCTVQTSSRHRPSTSSTSEFTRGKQLVITYNWVSSTILQTHRSTESTAHVVSVDLLHLFLLYLDIITDSTRTQSHPRTSNLGVTVNNLVSHVPYSSSLSDIIKLCRGFLRDQGSLTPD